MVTLAISSGVAPQPLDGDLGNLFGSDTRATDPWRDHARLEQRALEHDAIHLELAVDLRPNVLVHALGEHDVVVPVHQDLGLHERSETLALRDGSVCGQAEGRVLYGDVAGPPILGDGQHCPPLGEARALLVVLLASLGELVQASAVLLVVGARDAPKSCVHFNAHNDSLLIEDFHERPAVRSCLEQGLLVEDGAANVLVEPWRGEEQLAVLASVLLRVLDADVRETLPGRRVRLVGGQDPLTGGGNGLSSCDELLFERLSRVWESFFVASVGPLRNCPGPTSFGTRADWHGRTE